MADDSTAEMISMTTGVVTALRAAGMLRAEEGPPGGDAPPPPPPPPAPPRSVGDQVSIFPLVAVAKTFETQPKDLTQFTLTEARRSAVKGGDERGGDFELGFPPNDASYIPELERLLTAALSGGTIHARANVEITAVLLARAWYRAELRGLWVYGGSQ
jgi:hypothetical protein